MSLCPNVIKAYWEKREEKSVHGSDTIWNLKTSFEIYLFIVHFHFSSTRRVVVYVYGSVFGMHWHFFFLLLCRALTRSHLLDFNNSFNTVQLISLKWDFSSLLATFSHHKNRQREGERKRERIIMNILFVGLYFLNFRTYGSDSNALHSLFPLLCCSVSWLRCSDRVKKCHNHLCCMALSTT